MGNGDVARGRALPRTVGLAAGYGSPAASAHVGATLAPGGAGLAVDRQLHPQPGLPGTGGQAAQGCRQAEIVEDARVPGTTTPGWTKRPTHGIHPKVVQERLGHASSGITLDIYSHVQPSMQREVADLLDRFLAVAS